MKLTYLSFIIFVILKPFYFFNSGSLQPGDLFLILSIISYIYYKKDKLEINISAVDRLLFYFILCVILINGFYAIYHYRLDFVVSALHYVFNFLVVILFREYAKDNYFLDNLLKVCKFNLWIQLIIFLTGFGEYYSEARYMGTFNDPNQMSFFIYITLMIMFLISRIINKKIGIIYYLIVLFIIFQTASTGMFLAILSFVFLNLIFNISMLIKARFKIKTILFLNLTLIILAFFTAVNMDSINESLNDSFLIQRVEEKISKVGNTEQSNSYSDLSLIEERGIDKLLIYPERIILGVGQGYYSRFIQAAHMGEVHSTLPSVLFSYGIIPTVLLLLWFLKNIRKFSVVMGVVFIPLLIESFTLLNQRQPFFWMLFVLAYIYYKKGENEPEKLLDRN